MTFLRDRKKADAKGGAPLPLYRWHRRGAFVRSWASLAMWLSALGAYGFGLIRLDNLISDTLAVSCLILMNPPALWVFKRIRSRSSAERFGIFINFLEIVGYTAVIYSFGGIEATYLLPIYAALITYVGIMGPGYLPFMIAGLCSIAYGTLLTLEHLGVLPSLKINPEYYISWPNQLAILVVATALLLIVAFISSYTARLLKRNQDKLLRQNEELQRTAAKAREADRLKSEFLANVSHELRTPLNAIIGFSDLLKEECLGPLNAEQRESLRDINASGMHLLSIINDLLDTSKVEAGRMDLLLSETNLKDLLEESLRAFRERIREQGLTLTVDLNDCPGLIRVDERKVTQILYNLLSNALKFTPAGGEIRLSARELVRKDGRWVTKSGEVAAEPIRFDPDGMNGRRFVEVCVADTGIGLQPQDLERIFNPFEQVDGSLSRRYEGTGLGLSLTKRFVELHQGTVWAASAGKNMGSAFYLIIPV
jgi:signal transduction histidine kinase